MLIRRSLGLRRGSLLALIATIATCALAGAAGAAGRPAPDPQALARGAELVFLGRVVDLRYALSEPAEGTAAGIPHTFVTYEVRQVLRGRIDPQSARQASSHPGRTVTLRFAGGIRPADGAVLRVSTVPRFDLGDTDILFVRANGSANLPLVQMQNGRLRVIAGHLYSEEGQEIVPAGGGRLGWGAKHDFPEVTAHTVGDKLYEQRRDRWDASGESEEAEEGGGASRLEKGRAISLEAFAERFPRWAGPPPQGLRPVASADPEKPFRGPVAAPVAPLGEDESNDQR